MKYAIFENTKIEATKGATGICPICHSELISKCGVVKINHWAHKKIRNCDSWWENETEWHRSWKNNFPIDWQEIICYDELTGEKHIADVRTNYNLVMEFQHSHIDPKERLSREKFYRNMVWIVDGTRLTRDYSRFLKGSKEIYSMQIPGYYHVKFPYECFPSAWLGSFVPVIFDFKGMDSIDDRNDLRNYLYCLLPNQNIIDSTLVKITRESFINNSINGELLNKPQETQRQTQKPVIINKNNKRREGTHYYDPKKRRLIKKWRF